jgi:hypothetical protein
MPKIGNQRLFEDVVCDRCGSARKISKTWTEKIKNDHGTMILEHKQIICTNKECQKEFDSVIRKDAAKREALKQAKLEDAAKRETAKQADILKNVAIAKI